MATTRQQKNWCTTCGDMVGVFLCPGCQQKFCLNHTRDHRDHLQQGMNDINDNLDRLKYDIQGQNVPGYRNSLLDQIGNWEKRSTEKIRRLAEDIRQQISALPVDNASDLKEKIEQLQEQLRKASEDGGFYEDDLKEWSRRLHELQNLASQPEKLKIEEDADSRPFIPTISIKPISTDSAPGITSPNKPILANNNIRDNNATTVPPSEYPKSSNKPPYYSSPGDHQYDTSKKPNDDPEDHNQDSYSSGRHTLRFRIDQYGPTSSVVFGVVSKRKPIDAFVRENPTFYGWSEKNAVYLGGDIKTNYHGYKSDFQPGDIYSLLIDCEQKQLRLKNERTDTSYELDVDTTKCSFPWQPNVRIIMKND
ncbi:unnamed protein product [Rotaria socialis]|uniref:B box-type domain-containing protein n=1 Tax=Rotaria socialis TaxID=392032 RepID=A0A821FR55_9BILA|nr:unnamed protein product [Rotaria socialis]CAF3407508.1 unnamed protein product [Rotaria socialis]CAF3497314.1 unnamed protein product [Rotaria socialis]CAF3516054.1 unnamed protein product [Rotaria socialis]CAF3566887.1 unnamed protein product [Rotaria socialis]